MATYFQHNILNLTYIFYTETSRDGMFQIKIEFKFKKIFEAIYEKLRAANMYEKIKIS